ncbi:putative serine esterase-domain-containing protein [Xylariaceae sp. FL0255]|nr:putative serine esterase-domain-containing protein [Xylariaceae sp. FL0255]
MDFNELNGGNLAANHLCVLVHGLWGNPNHLNQMAAAIRATHSKDQLYLLYTKSNSGNFTYDGIETCGERVCREIEEELEKIRTAGGNIIKISIVGYSLGGLFARYAVGLLYANGILDQVEPVNFTTFATPHLGVRTPLRGWHSEAWNVLGAKTLSESGRQLFLIDSYRDTERPLLEILTDPDSIFITGLKKFKRRTLYSNIINDRTVPHFTSMITKTDPYVNLAKLKPNFVKGYDDVILDPHHPYTSASLAVEKGSLLNSVTSGGLEYVKNGPFLVAFAFLLPLGITAFLLNSVVQTVRSSRRIHLHEMGQAGIQIEKYRMPIWIKELRGTVEDAYENINNSQKQEYLTPVDDDSESRATEAGQKHILALERRQSQADLPTLALAPSQFTMIKALDTVGFRKYPVWIHRVRHSHAAIITRIDKETYREGEIVFKHWLNEEFII